MTDLGARLKINRGEIWSVAWTGQARKPRPALVMQAEEYRLTETDILALITTTENEASAVRLPVKADAHNGLQEDSFICLDKLMAIPLANIEKCRRMLSESQNFLVSAPWCALAPGTFIMITVIAFHYLGEGAGKNMRNTG
jgi:mRNA-degrading endonuclease toxin of MazEF toxin-antitoxin module